MRRLAAAGVATALGLSSGVAQGQDPAPAGARNVILLIGDGLGDSETTLARNYWVGAGGRLGLDTLPFTGAMTTFSVEDGDPRSPRYVPDSASTATAIATGVKTSDKRIATAAGTGRPLTTILELAQQRGMRTGLVTTGGLSTATEAAMAAHVRHRACMGPQAMSPCPHSRRSRGGAGSIAEQQVDHRIDVLLGGGRRFFTQRIDGGPGRGRTVIQDARLRHGYHVVYDTRGLLQAPASGRLLGVFTPVGMRPEWLGRLARPRGTIPHRCLQGRAPASQPSLATMTLAALRRLEDVSGRQGFFALVEGAGIDTQAHEAHPCGQIGETIGFDRAVRLVLEYARARPNTLVILTGDHAHATQIVPANGRPPAGRWANLRTRDGAVMRVTYASAASGAQQHTGTQIRIAATGPLGQRVLGVIDQTDVFRIMRDAIGP